MMFLYKVLCFTRLCLVLWPQVGYIHPDEHFQGPEVVYGDILQYDVHRPWEFTSSKPIRSIVFPYFVSVMPAVIIRTLSFLHFHPDAYLLLILPRLLMCLLSFFQDFCIYKICSLLNLKHESPLLFFGSSYVTLAYLTRTFSNSLESLYFGVLLLLLIMMLKLRDSFHKRSKTDQLVERYLFLSFVYGKILVLGFFNRPTFICFSIIPTIMVIYLIFKINVFPKSFVFAALILGCLSTFTYLTIIDSFYYSKTNYLSNIHFNSIICTPLNFFLYNSNTENLAVHGLHSRWIHLFVNIPLLFSIFGIFVPIYSLKNCLSFIRQFKLDFELLFLFFFTVPLVVFSMIPHQEPRFLVPLIVPLSLLLPFHKFKKYSLFTCVWIITNFFCLSFYGFVHQAGVYSSMEHLGTKNINNSLIVFHKTYMPPRYLLSIEKSLNAKVIDFAGCSEGDLHTGLQSFASKYKASKIFLIGPSPHTGDYRHSSTLNRFNYKLVKTVYIFPHFSTENLPDFESIEVLAEKNLPVLSRVILLKKLFSIQILSFKKS